MCNTLPRCEKLLLPKSPTTDCPIGPGIERRRLSRRSKSAPSDLSTWPHSQAWHLGGLPRASAVPCRGMLLTVLSVQQGLAPTAQWLLDRTEDFLPSHLALHGACSSSGMCTAQPLHPPADFMCDGEERLSGTIVQVNCRTAIATRCRLVQGIRNSNHSGRRACEAYRAMRKYKARPQSSLVPQGQG